VGMAPVMRDLKHPDYLAAHVLRALVLGDVNCHQYARRGASHEALTAVLIREPDAAPARGVKGPD
jgi:hypothetical protein